ncbi:phenol hydroxylase subunit P4 [Tomitella fengzijianii]|uniref:Phenol hydroxylase n=1 Tax=Tomitella fengzijianii TaxID=2597660 RepID=A0A516X558_9ACTN|nr:phenol hydroxylase subunit P4 [Tomitella fengzijianii]QDQ98218.1 phenol hydroxylase [Tomitella fengzijianii]
MTVKALYEYDYPSADRAELYGDDQLVYVYWRGNLLFSSAGCFRVPRAVTFADFQEQFVDGWAASDPDFDAGAVGGWQLFDEPITPDPHKTLEQLGVGHKALLSFSA